jgi:hypothetical protein
MSQQYATVVRRCRECGVEMYGPTGTHTEVWPLWLETLQGHPVSLKGVVFMPFHECAGGGKLGGVEGKTVLYRYVAPFPDPAATITDPEVISAMAPPPGAVTGYDIDQANTSLPGGGK